MTLIYPTEYRDRYGTELSTFISNGESLRISLRGIGFEGDFYELTPIESNKEQASKLFDLNENGSLSAIQDFSPGANPPDFSLHVKLPLKVISLENKKIDAYIDLKINPNSLYMVIQGKTYAFEKPNFEYGLTPANTKSFEINYVQCCVNCKFSEYSPFGSDLMCFKNCKETWLNMDYSDLKDLSNWKKIKQMRNTQEAFYCETFTLNE